MAQKAQPEGAKRQEAVPVKAYSPLSFFGEAASEPPQLTNPTAHTAEIAVMSARCMPISP